MARVTFTREVIEIEDGYIVKGTAGQYFEKLRGMTIPELLEEQADPPVLDETIPERDFAGEMVEFMLAVRRQDTKYPRLAELFDLYVALGIIPGNRVLG